MAKRKETIALICFWLTLLPMYGTWLVLDQVVSPWDMAGHAKASYDIWHKIIHGRLVEAYLLSNYYPPLFHFLAAPLTAITSNPDIYCLPNWIMLLVTMFFTMKIGTHLSGIHAGLAAGILIPAYTYISLMCRQPMLDLTLTAMTTATLFLMVRGKRIHDPGQAHALGIAIALGLLAKWPYVFFATIPLMIHIVLEAVNAIKKNEVKALLRGLFILGLWPILVAGPWYLRAVPHILHKSRSHLNGDIAALRGQPVIYTLDNLIFYANTMWESYLTRGLLLLAVLGLLFFIRDAWRKKTGSNRKAGWSTLWIMFISGYLIMTCISNKDPRFIMPLVPVVALVSTHWVGRFNRGSIYLLVAAVMILSWTTAYCDLFVIERPERREMGIEKAAKWITEHRPQKATKVLVIPEEWTLNAAAIHYTLYRKDRHCSAQTLFTALTENALRKFQFIVLTDPPGENSAGAPYQIANTRKVMHLADWKIFTTIARGDNKKILILGRRNESHHPVTGQKSLTQ